MPGSTDPYVLARRVLLDALEGLGSHRDAVTLVGAQAVYLRVGEADIAVAPTTTDADLALDPTVVKEWPPLDEIMQVMSAIGNHHEEHADPATNVSAALILADKADVHKSRVRNPSTVKFDIHDRVNYAVQRSQLQVIPEQNVIRLDLTVNTKISQVMEYFEIFLSRMVVSRRAADFLGSHYELAVNGNQLL